MSRRLLKAAEAIREVVASTILTEVRDPRVKDVTVIGVEVSPDMREAKVSVSVMGTENQQDLAIRGLQNCAGFLQSKIANRIEARYTPKLTFKLDKGLQNALVVSELLNKIKQEKSGAGSPDTDALDQAGELDQDDSIDSPETSGDNVTPPRGDTQP
ncbi:30S ribosome-binding factor RbfA [Novipirellula rosea]|uniref:Ribosome-binding factor A n=1 Tax=Novipirellula rosea TaxID=1031540 RepID=A0ABP8NND5_9BACT